MDRAFYKVGTIIKDADGRWWKIIEVNTSPDNVMYYTMDCLDRKADGSIVTINWEAMMCHKTTEKVTKAEQVLYGKID